MGGANNNIDDSSKDSKSFNYKISITGKLEGTKKEKVKIAVPLKYLRNFWRTLDIPLINFEINLILTWHENFAKQQKILTLMQILQ